MKISEELKKMADRIESMAATYKRKDLLVDAVIHLQIAASLKVLAERATSLEED